MSETKRKTIGEMSGDTRILINYITKRMIKDGEESISYADLCSAIGGRDVQNDARGILATARKHVEDENNILIETVSTVGIKKSKQYVGVLAFATKQVRRLSGKAVRRVAHAVADKYADLSNEEKIGIGAYMSGLAAIRLCGEAKNIRKIEGRLKETSTKELPTAETLRLFEK